MKQHTPGPWTAKATASLGPQYVVYPEAAGPNIAIVYDHGNTKENAFLIAAAPELLEACKEAACALKVAGVRDPDQAGLYSTLLLEMAILKAEGLL